MRIVDANGNIVMATTLLKKAISGAHAKAKDASNPRLGWNWRYSCSHLIHLLFFWLDENRPHGLIRLRNKVGNISKDTTQCLTFVISCLTTKRWSFLYGESASSWRRRLFQVTGNILRDYLTDLIPNFGIRYLCEMLLYRSNAGRWRMYETGAAVLLLSHVSTAYGRKPPSLDSLGDSWPWLMSFEEPLVFKHNNEKAIILSKCLDKATG